MAHHRVSAPRALGSKEFRNCGAARRPDQVFPWPCPTPAAKPEPPAHAARSHPQPGDYPASQSPRCPPPQTAWIITVKALGGIGARLFLQFPAKPRSQGKLLLNGQQPLPLQRPIPSARTLATATEKANSLPKEAFPQLEQFLAWRSWLHSPEAPTKPGEYSGPLTTCTSPNCPLPPVSLETSDTAAAGGRN